MSFSLIVTSCFLRLTSAAIKDCRTDPSTGQSHDAEGDQDSGPVELLGSLQDIRRRGRLCWSNGGSLKDGHIAGLIQGDAADGSGVVRGHGVALDITAGGASGVGGHSSIAVPDGISVHAGSVVRLPVDILEGQCVAIVFDALGDVLGVLTRQIGITAGGPDFLGK